MREVIYKSVIFKSILSFLGLAAAGWIASLLTDLMLHNIHSPVFLALMNLTLFQYILWILLTIAYSYTLFLLFKNDKHPWLIMSLNGAAALFLQFYILFILKISTEDIKYLSIMISVLAFFSSIVSAFIFKNITRPKKTGVHYKTPGKAANTFIVFVKSALCFLTLPVILYILDYLIHKELSVFGIFAFEFRSPFFTLTLAVLFYAFLQYKLFNRNLHRRLIMILNAVFLIVVWALDAVFYIFPALPGFDPLLFAILCGNTGLALFALTFVFDSVKRHGISSDTNIIKADDSPSAYPRSDL